MAGGAALAGALLRVGAAVRGRGRVVGRVVGYAAPTEAAEAAEGRRLLLVLGAAAAVGVVVVVAAAVGGAAAPRVVDGGAWLEG